MGPLVRSKAPKFDAKSVFNGKFEHFALSDRIGSNCIFSFLRKVCNPSFLSS